MLLGVPPSVVLLLDCFPRHFRSPTRPHAADELQGHRCTSDLVHRVGHGSHRSDIFVDCSPSCDRMDCTARIKRFSHRFSLGDCLIYCPILSDKTRPDSPHLFLSLSAGTTLVCVPRICLWPEAVVHNDYILVVMTVKKDEGVKESRLEG